MTSAPAVEPARREVSPPDTSPRVSVLVPTRNRPVDFARCLQSILANTYENFEVLVIDQGEPGVLAASVPALADERVTLLHESIPGKTRSLNRALQVAAGEFLVVTDDDCAVEQDWIDHAVRPFRDDPGLAVVFGPLQAMPHDSAVLYVPIFLPRETQRLQGTRDRLKCHGVGANVAVRTESLRAIGGWDECMGPGGPFCCGDDVDIAYRAMHAGMAVLVVPGNPVTHYGARSLADGSARTLLRNNFVGIGGRLAKELRCGDPLAAVAFARITGREAVELVRRSWQQRRVVGAGRLLYLFRGALQGFRQPLDRRHRAYIPRDRL